jgi:ESS family glutamate:Na+ symporter
MSTGGLGAMVYHLLGLSFVAMTLRKSHISGKKGDLRIVSTAVSILSQYAVQAVLGLAITLLFMATIMPKLFPAFGFLLPLGYVLGPGQAYAIGQGWEPFGFEGAGTLGLTFAALGFLWACFGGVVMINYGLRKGWMSRSQIQVLYQKAVKTGLYGPGEKLPVGSHLTTETEAIDSMTFNLAIVLFVYVLTYFLLQLLTFLLSFAGKLGHDLAVNLWGIHFIFAALCAMGVKHLMKGLRIDHVLDNGSLTRVGGLSVDLMLAASIGAISLVVVTRYWLPIAIMSTVGGFVVFYTVPWFCSRLFTDHRFHRTLMIYGVSTGTMPTGLALLRVIDPDFETPVATDYMYASGLTFVLAIPFIMIINLPAYSYTTGNPLYLWIAVAVSLGYLVFVLIAYQIISKKRAYQDPSSLWLKEEAKGQRIA